MTTFQVEPVAMWEKDCMDLVVAHWRELGLDQDLEISPDFEAMKRLESLGMWSVITVRDETKLVGYLLAVINKHLHYSKSAPVFIVDAYYLDPEYRTGNGVKLFRFAENQAHRLGAIKIYASCKIHQDHTKLFLALGYRASDVAFTKRLY